MAVARLRGAHNADQEQTQHGQQPSELRLGGHPGLESYLHRFRCSYLFSTLDLA